MPRVAIIGGGISGLTLAYRLRQYLADVDVQILESETNVGGTNYDDVVMTPGGPRGGRSPTAGVGLKSCPPPKIQRSGALWGPIPNVLGRFAGVLRGGPGGPPALLN